MKLLATVRELMVEYGVSTLQQMMPTVVKVEGAEERADGCMAFLPVLACRDCMRLKGDVARYPLPIQAMRHVQEYHGKGNVTSRETREVAEAEWGSWILGISKHLEVTIEDISPDVSDYSSSELAEMARKTGPKILKALEQGGEARKFTVMADEATGLEWLYPYRVPRDLESEELEAVEASIKWLTPVQQKVLRLYVQQHEPIPDDWERAIMKGEHGVPTHVEEREESRREVRASIPPPPQPTAAASQMDDKARRRGK
jgi:hypothetical protein